MDYKDIENINTEFKKGLSQEEITKKNEKIEKLKEKVSAIEKDINEYNEQKENYKNSKNMAEKAGNTTLAGTLQTEIDNLNTEISKQEAKKNKIVKQLQNLEKTVSDNKSKVDSYMEELSKDPGFKKHIDTAMKKKLARRSEKALKENEMLKNLQELIKLQPECEDYVAKMKEAQDALDLSNSKIEKLNEEIKSLDPVADAATIAKKQAEISKKQAKIDKDRKTFNTNKTEIKKAAKKHKIELDEEQLKNFIRDTAFKRDKANGKLLVARTVNRKMLGNEKTLLNNQIALSKLEGKVMYTDLEDRTDDDGNVRPLNETGMEIKQKSFAPVPVAEKPKWYQFRKRFQNWRQNRKAQREDKTAPVYTRKEYEQEAEEKAEPNNFKNSLKYEVVQEYARRREHEVLKDAKDTIKDLDDERDQ